MTNDLLTREQFQAYTRQFADSLKMLSESTLDDFTLYELVMLNVKAYVDVITPMKKEAL